MASGVSGGRGHSTCVRIMDQTTFRDFKELIYERSGISLQAGKEAMVSARVAKRLRALGMPDSRTYLQYVRRDKSGEELVQLLNVISTNVTSFFREPDHFDFFSEVISKWSSEGQRRFRFWSAASSTGEEPYTIAMTFLEAVKDAKVDMRILATDISTRVLERCVVGQYEKRSLETVPKALKARYFDKEGRGEDAVYRAKSILKDRIVFKRLNLSKPPFPMKGPLDVVFCRNVMIYFDKEVRKNLLEEISRLLRPGGYLMVGHSENLVGLSMHLEVVRPSIYLKR